MRERDPSAAQATGANSGADWVIAPREYARMESRRGRRHAYQQLTPRTTALVVVDMVPFFVDANPPCLTAAEGIGHLAAQLRHLGGTVAWVVPSLGEPTSHAIGFYGPDVAALYAGSGGSGEARGRIWSGFDIDTDDLVVEKTASSAFFPGRCDLHLQLMARGIDTVLITGTVTNVCCESSVRDASTLGYRVVMVADLNVGGDFATRSATFTVVYRSFGDIRTSSEVSNLLQRGQ
ncbi:cysteine hydrolase [Microlunatus aurantiacus]|uniref:Cysteine hydrolase n=2 Tax=Microlunatus aurantiacus TaxID=446786 RepID=A0ABP7DMW6_9ACTN